MAAQRAQDCTDHDAYRFQMYERTKLMYFMSIMYMWKNEKYMG